MRNKNRNLIAANQIGASLLTAPTWSNKAQNEYRVPANEPAHLLYRGGELEVRLVEYSDDEIEIVTSADIEPGEQFLLRLKHNTAPMLSCRVRCSRERCDRSYEVTGELRGWVGDREQSIPAGLATPFQSIHPSSTNSVHG